MDFALDEDQVALQSVLREFLTDRSPEAAVRAQLEDTAGYDRNLWDLMAGQLGVCGMAIPEEYGGAGFSFLELGLVLEELGRSLTVSPFFAACVMAAQLLLAVDDATWLRAQGYRRVAVLGWSMGGSVVLRHAGLGGDADAVVS